MSEASGCTYVLKEQLLKADGRMSVFGSFPLRTLFKGTSSILPFIHVAADSLLASQCHPFRSRTRLGFGRGKPIPVPLLPASTHPRLMRPQGMSACGTSGTSASWRGLGGYVSLFLLCCPSAHSAFACPSHPAARRGLDILHARHGRLGPNEA